MPQADLTTFHSLSFSIFILILAFFSFVYYYITPFWSVVTKLSVKKIFILFFISKIVKKGFSDFIEGNRGYKAKKGSDIRI